METRLIQPVILCGGIGSRLWPLSRAERPKPLLALAAGRNMLAATLDRVADARRFAPPILVGSASLREALAAEAGAASRLVLEPVGRNTAPAAAVAALLAEPPDRLLLVMPSDHLIAQPDKFREAIETASPFAEDGLLMTFGIEPTRPEPGYGYILPERPLSGGARLIAAFIEKPDRAYAERLIQRGCFWNSGIFLFRADRYLEALRDYEPEVADAADRSLAGADLRAREVLPESGAFAASPSLSIDVAVMRLDPQRAVVPVAMGWSDLGGWEAVRELGPLDGAGNALHGPVEVRDVRGSLVHSSGPRVVAIGVEDLIVVVTQDAVLVTRPGTGSELKAIIEKRGEKG